MMIQYLQALKLEDWKNISDIFFSLTGALIALLAYLSARKTILSPLKTEVLKKQLNAIENVLEYISIDGLPTGSLDEKIDVHGLWKTGLDYLGHSYLSACLHETQRPNGELEELLKSYQSRIERKSFCVRKTENVGDTLLSPLTIRQWRQLPLYGVFLTQKYERYDNAHFSVCYSPWLPQEITQHVESYVQSVSDITGEILDLLNKVKKEKFDKASKEEILRLLKQDEFNLLYWEYYNEISLNELFERAERINSAIRKYLKINKLMK